MSPFLAIDGDLVNRNSSLVVPLITSTVIAFNFIAEFSCTHIVYCRAATKNVQSFVSQHHAPETSRKCQAGYELPLICQYVITFTSFQPYRSQRRTPATKIFSFLQTPKACRLASFKGAIFCHSFSLVSNFAHSESDPSLFHRLPPMTYK